MSTQIVTCPQCGKKFPLTEALSQELEAKLRTGFEREAEQRKAEFQQALDRKEREMREALAKERQQAEAQASQRAKEVVETEMKDLRLRIAEKSQQLDQARQLEMDLRKRQRDLEDRERNLRLEVERTLDAERKAIWEQAQQKVGDEHRLRELEKDKQLADMRKQIEDLKHKAELTSQQAQGEVLEIELETILTQQFRQDMIDPVAKGVRGADVVQTVRDERGRECGKIVWESKRTKAWSDGWISKLKDDQRTARAEIAVIVSTALPKEINRFGLYDGVWVTDFASAVGLAAALRVQLSQLSYARSAVSGKNEKMEVLYAYLSGPEFARRVEAIVEAFRSMKEDLEAEKRAMEKIWTKRETQITRVLKNTSGMYGELQGMIGAELPQVKSLELPGGTEDLF